MLIRDRLDAAFETEPPDVPVEQRLTAGRAALRRRRVGQSALSVAAVVLICTGAVAIGGRSPDVGHQLAPATGNTSTAGDGEGSTAPTPGDDLTTTSAERWPYPGELAYVTEGGHVQPAPDVTLRYTITSPAQAPHSKAIAVAVRSENQIWWLAMTWRRGAEAVPYTSVGPFDTYQPTRFHDWVLQLTYRRGPTGPDSAADSSGSAITADLRLVHFEGDALVAEPGVTILLQRPDPHFTNFARPGDMVAVAEVRDSDGKRWFVVVRSEEQGAAENVSAPAGVGEVPHTLDGFVDWARQKYDEGTGLL